MFDTTKANCVGIDTELFFTEKYYDPFELKFLKRICDACEIKKQCRDYAVTHDVDGFWAGMTKHERKKERKRLGIVAITLFQEIYKQDESRSA